MTNRVLFSESRGLYSPKINYVDVNTSENDRVLQQVSEDDTLNKPLISRYLNSLRLTISQVFLPYGYPDSVSRDYLQYQIYDTIQAFCSSLTGALATEAVMKGVGVGDDTATPLAAAVTWLLKSGSGMIGQIMFTWSQGTNLDSECKKWRFFADVVNDTATCIDLLSPLLSPTVRLPIFLTSSVARSLVGVAGGATRAAITQHQARSNNTADVSAKDGSQETLVNLLALIASLVILPLVSGNHVLVWTLFFLFTAGHLAGNYKALKSLELESLNGSRLLHCLKKFITTSFNSVLTVREVNQVESVFLGFDIKESDVTAGGYRIRLGVSLELALSHNQLSRSSRSSTAYSLRQLEDAIAESGQKKFLLIPNREIRVINVILHEDASPWEIVEAYSRAIFLSHILEDESGGTTGLGNQSTFELTTHKWLKFEAALVNMGFATDWAVIKADGDWRATWKTKL